MGETPGGRGVTRLDHPRQAMRSGEFYRDFTEVILDGDAE
jgi:hypothetical protein